MSILIIGCNGFIGKHLASALISSKNDVYGIDINPECSLQGIKYFDFKHSLNECLISVLKLVNFDCCINASGAANVHESILNPTNDFELNTLNVFRILESIRIFQPSCTFINLSSTAVYGKIINTPICESTALMPQSPYGFHKQAAEIICTEYRNIYGIKTYSLRLFFCLWHRVKKTTVLGYI